MINEQAGRTFGHMKVNVVRGQQLLDLIEQHKRQRAKTYDAVLVDSEKNALGINQPAIRKAAREHLNDLISKAEIEFNDLFGVRP